MQNIYVHLLNLRHLRSSKHLENLQLDDQF